MFKAIVPNPDDEGIILVRGVPFGSPNDLDVHKQFFSPRTNFLSHIMPLPPLFHFHGAKSGSLADAIGETLSREERKDGIYYKAKLHINSTIDAIRQKAVQLWEAAKAGKLFASSGAVPATIKIADNGEILQWLVGELSLMDSRTTRELPASFHATVVPLKADLSGVDASGDSVVDDLNILEPRYTDIVSFEEFLISEMRAFYPNKNQLEDGIKSLSRQIVGPDNNIIIEDRSSDVMPEENDLLAQMQAQMAQMQAQMAELTQTNATLQNDLTQRDSQITELQGIVSTKSAEVAMGAHSGLVENWIKDGKITPAEKDHVLEVLSFAYQADATVKGDIGFVNAVKGMIEARPVNPIMSNPSKVYSNLNGSTVEGVGGGVDPANVARLARYAEVTLPK